MKPPKTDHSKTHLFLPRISSFINPKNPLKSLADSIDWSFFAKEFTGLYKEGCGYPPRPIRLMVSLIMLQHMHNLSDEKTVSFWLQNPYWQYFSGYDYMQWKASIHPSSLTRFRKRLGESGMQKILSATIKEGLKQGAIKKKELSKVIVDTTVMEKNICYPTDSKLVNKARKNLVKLSQGHNIMLRQNYNRLGKKESIKVARYAHAKQFKRMKRSTKKLKNFLGCVKRNIERELKKNPQKAPFFKKELDIAQKLLEQKKESKNKVYSTHEPTTYCLAKGKARTPYEYGCKVSIVSTQKKGFVLNVKALSSNQHDAHTLENALFTTEKITSTVVKEALVDRGYRGHSVKNTTVYISGQKRGLSTYMRRKIKKRAGIEACISELKRCGKMKVNYLKGQLGDKVNALACGIGHNMRRLVSHTLLFIFFYSVIYALDPKRKFSTIE